jgi:TM2 domain-containing membrane protein YozV
MATEQAGTKAADEQFCSSCGETIKKEAEVCPECGVRQESSSSSEKDPGIAALLSAITSGWAGQMYNGQILRGLGIIVAQVVNVILMAFLIGFLTFPLVWALGIYDAYNQAKKINAGEVQV